MKHKIKIVLFFIALLTAVSVFAVSCADGADTRSEGENAGTAGKAADAGATNEGESTSISDNPADDAADGATDNDSVENGTDTECEIDLAAIISTKYDYSYEDVTVGFNDAVSVYYLLEQFGFDISASDYSVTVEGTGSSFGGGFYQNNATGDELELAEVGTSCEITEDNLGTMYWSMPEDMVTIMLLAADSGRNVDSLIITAREDGNIVKAAYVEVFFKCDHSDGFMEGYDFYAVTYECVTFPKTESGEYQNVTMDYVRSIFSSDV